MTRPASVMVPGYAHEAVLQLVQRTALHWSVEFQDNGRRAVLKPPLPNAAEVALFEVVRWFCNDATAGLIGPAGRVDAQNQDAIESALRTWLRAGALA